jgi:hypothetical protein
VDCWLDLDDAAPAIDGSSPAAPRDRGTLRRTSSPRPFNFGEASHMRTLARYAFNIGTAAALLAGCGGSQPPVAAPGVMAPSHAIPWHAAHGRSWMRSAASATLLYVSQGTTVEVYTFPQGELVGTLSGFQRAAGDCDDRAGNVFITDEFAGTISKYAHGGTSPTLILSNVGRNPYGCSVDPKSGDLSVVSFGTSPSGGVFIYKKAKGSVTEFADPSIYNYYYCGYDNNGNLFVEGSNNLHRDAGLLAELPKGGSAFQTVTLDNGFSPGGGVQWDGTDLALESPNGKHNTQGPTVIDRVHISGSTGTMTTPVYLSTGKSNQNPGVGTQFWIDGNSIVKQEYTSRGVGRWKYPAGGKVVSTFKAHESFGLTISAAK